MCDGYQCDDNNFHSYITYSRLSDWSIAVIVIIVLKLIFWICFFYRRHRLRTIAVYKTFQNPVAVTTAKPSPSNQAPLPPNQPTYVVAPVSICYPQ
ncbi:unnamed protein product [Clavelina lepadiformis]|uniref:ATP synthase F0 subunit 8 n=1 Tax=Clavelina lepadiformis TaxID=159417 RepID=A0ABP0GWT3_CLALP